MSKWAASRGGSTFLETTKRVPTPKGAPPLTSAFTYFAPGPAGLVIGIVTFEPVEPGSADVGRILAQTPPPNLEVSAETTVDVVVGEPSDFESD